MYQRGRHHCARAKPGTRMFYAVGCLPRGLLYGMPRVSCCVLHDWSMLHAQVRADSEADPCPVCLEPIEEAHAAMRCCGAGGKRCGTTAGRLENKRNEIGVQSSFPPFFFFFP